MINRQTNYSAIPLKSDMEFLLEKIQNLEQEISDLTFEFKREVNDRRRTA